MRWIAAERERLASVRQAANQWGRARELDDSADEIRNASRRVEAKLGELEAEIDTFVARIRGVARVDPHSIALHLRGDLRHLQGLPPDRPVRGLDDCRIYEAILDVVGGDQARIRDRYLITQDSDFDDPLLRAELHQLGVQIRKDPGRLYSELRPAT